MGVDLINCVVRQALFRHFWHILNLCDLGLITLKINF